MELFVQGIQKKFGLELLGIDVIIENDTGRYAVIDINAFPGGTLVLSINPLTMKAGGGWTEFRDPS